MCAARLAYAGTNPMRLNLAIDSEQPQDYDAVHVAKGSLACLAELARHRGSIRPQIIVGAPGRS